MPNPPSDSGSLRGRGAEILLPKKGNPFEGEQPPTPEDIFTVGAEANPEPEPVSFSLPQEPVGLPEMPMGGRRDEPESAPETEMMSFGLDVTGMGEAAPAGMPEPTDLSPEDLAAMFPSTPTDRSLSADSLAPVSEADLKSFGSFGADADLVAHDLPPAPEPATLPHPEIASFAAGGFEPYGSSPDTVAPPPAPVAAALPSIELSPEKVGISLAQYKPGDPLPPNAELVKIFIPDAQLVNLWAELDVVEKEVVSTARLSQKQVTQLVGRLAEARNRLMADRSQYEEAIQQLSSVRYVLNRVKQSGRDQQPRVIMAYLLFAIGLLVVALLSTSLIMRTVGPLIAVEGFDFKIVWLSILWGGLGGVTGALYGLWKHVAQDDDYDPQFALWYYTNPLMGVVLGGFVYLIMQAGLLAATLGGSGGAVTPSPYLTYFLAWVVGFQQNVAFTLVNSVLKSFMKLTPEGKDDKK